MRIPLRAAYIFMHLPAEWYAHKDLCNRGPEAGRHGAVDHSPDRAAGEVVRDSGQMQWSNTVVTRSGQWQRSKAVAEVKGSGQRQRSKAVVKGSGQRQRSKTEVKDSGQMQWSNAAVKRSGQGQRSKAHAYLSCTLKRAAVATSAARYRPLLPPPPFPRLAPRRA